MKSQKSLRYQNNGFIVNMSLFIIIIITFKLTRPFDFSNLTLLRIFTENKIISYIFILMIIREIFKGRIKEIFKIPGIVLLFLLQISMLITVLDADNIVGSFNFYLYSLGGMFFYLIIIFSVDKLENIKILANWLIIMGIFFIFIEKLGILRLPSLLPLSSSSQEAQEQIFSQTHYQSTALMSTLTRNSFLWFDANNFAYLLGSLLVFNLFFVFNEENKSLFYLRLISFCILFISLITTLSRGGNLAFIISALLLVIFSKTEKNQKIKLILIIFQLLFFIFLMVLPFQMTYLTELIDRFFLSIGLFGFGRASLLVTGLELGRLDSAAIAINDFLQKPFFGWGAYQIGKIGNTGNHLFYLNFLGYWGFIGFSLFVLIYIKIIKTMIICLNFIKSIDIYDYNLGITLVSLFTLDIVRGFFAASGFYFSGGLIVAYVSIIYKKYKGKVGLESRL